MVKVSQNRQVYDLEKRTFKFARAVRLFIKTLPNTLANIEDGKQLIRASGSVGANYIEANEAVSKKDFLYRIKISRKESKECIYWLRLINETNNLNNSVEVDLLIDEAEQLKKILSTIIKKSQ
ncbi:four helix bundle protein [bacterium]|nr:four helix bundle protein [bacterium]